MTKVEIQLLSDQLPAEYPEILAEIDLLREGLFKEIGWHYYVDLIWVIIQLRKLGIMPGATVLDAGAGSGLLQFLLSYYGYHVLSVDFAPRRVLFHISKLFPVEITSSSESSKEEYIEHLETVHRSYSYIRKLWIYIFKRKRRLSSWFHLRKVLSQRDLQPGKITMIQNDMCQMHDVQDQSVDAVVSLSAVEHLNPDQLPLVFADFSRVMKADASLILTTNASGTKKDWFHEPSQGWCFSLSTLAGWFNEQSSSERCFTNFNSILADYQNNKFLRQRLADFHFYSEKSGMPKGVWNPAYIPVGVVARRNDLPGGPIQEGKLDA